MNRTTLKIGTSIKAWSFHMYKEKICSSKQPSFFNYVFSHPIISLHNFYLNFLFFVNLSHEQSFMAKLNEKKYLFLGVKGFIENTLTSQNSYLFALTNSINLTRNIDYDCLYPQKFTNIFCTFSSILLWQLFLSNTTALEWL